MVAQLQYDSSNIDDVLFSSIAEALFQQGYFVLPNALPSRVSDALMQHLAMFNEAEFSRAEIGRGQAQTHNTFVRRDKIAWIESTSPHSQVWLNWTQALQTFLNRRLFMGLFSFESHFAFYRPGDFYQKHVDAFRGQSNRMLSLVTYLNKDWQPDQGGELVIYNSESGSELIKVTPNFGTLVLFLSEEFPHEVLRADRTRYSVAGWFRVNSSTSERVDPPR